LVDSSPTYAVESPFASEFDEIFTYTILLAIMLQVGLSKKEEKEKKRKKGRILPNLIIDFFTKTILFLQKKTQSFFLESCIL